MGTLEAIEMYGLATRQIPKQIASLYAMRHHKPGNEIVERLCTSLNFGPFNKKYGNDPAYAGCYRYDHENKKIYSLFSQEITIPEHAGWWMVQPSHGTSSRMEWNKKRDFLAPTLAESVTLFLASIS